MKYINSIAVSIILIFSILILNVSVSADFIKPGKRDKCPVCGMFVYKYSNWSAQIIFKDKTYVIFDGPKDMFTYYFNISKYDKKRSLDDIEEIYVTDYYTTKVVSVKEVFFLIGSDIKGPMGEELVPVKGKKEALMFMQDHGAVRRLAFEAVTVEDLPGYEE